MIRVASWPPWYAPNRYIERFHDAMAGYDVVHVPNLPLNAREMVQHGVQVAHLHWAEWAWQSRGQSVQQQHAGLHELSRFLDDAASEQLIVVWTVHNLATHEGQPAVDEIGFAQLHARVALRIFHSEHAADEARVLYPEAGGDVLVMPHGNYDGVLPFPRSREMVRTALRVPEHAVLLTCIGNVRRYKGFDVVLEAMALSHNENLYVTVEGRCRDEDLRRELESMSRRLPRVRCKLDPLSDQRYSDVLHACDAVLLPYREVTGSGALLSALTTSRSVIATDLPYFREATRHEPLAAVFSADASAAGLLNAIEVHQQVAVDERSAAARRLADRYAWDRVVAPVAAWLHRHVPQVR